MGILLIQRIRDEKSLKGSENVLCDQIMSFVLFHLVFLLSQVERFHLLWWGR